MRGFAQLLMLLCSNLFFAIVVGEISIDGEDLSTKFYDVDKMSPDEIKDLERKLQTNTDNECLIKGGKYTCPADSSFSADGQSTQLDAEVACPLNAVTQANFIAASQNGLCECSASLANSDEEVACDCFACPEGATVGFAFVCENRIVGECFNFSCGGDCNGDLFDLDFETFAPTPSPVYVNSGAATAEKAFVVATSLSAVVVAMTLAMTMMA